MIRDTFNSYISCKRWLEGYPDLRRRFFESLPGTGISGISYEEFVSTGANHGMKLSKISDKMAEFDKINKQMITQCKSTIQICEIWLELARPKNKDLLIQKFMIEKRTDEEVANIVGYERSWVKRRIDSEIEYLLSIK
ncbi:MULTISPECIES: hypothetical protein [Erysipelothrix]|uniref:hypothetical protein n=1 Tax=Erysipelothrix TaxID=1647 RepID=UPI00135BE37F|nr:MULTISPECIES: hypothetical protein [Erysipelothrix]